MTAWKMQPSFAKELSRSSAVLVIVAEVVAKVSRLFEVRETTVSVGGTLLLGGCVDEAMTSGALEDTGRAGAADSTLGVLASESLFPPAVVVGGVIELLS